MSDNIRSPEAVYAYLEAAFEDEDPKVILFVLGEIAKSEGMAEIAKKTGVGRESLYKSLSESGNPSFETVLKVFDAVGIRLRPVRIPELKEVAAVKK